MRRSAAWLAGAVLVLAAGCNTAVCARHSDCPVGDRCSAAGTCELTRPVDAAPPDGAHDAATAGDAAVPDAPAADATVHDSLPLDAEMP